MLGLMPLLFDPPPPALLRARPFLIALVALAVAFFALEWLVVH
jgi:hypothetical protein